MENATEKKLADLGKSFHDALIVATRKCTFITIMEAVTEGLQRMDRYRPKKDG